MNVADGCSQGEGSRGVLQSGSSRGQCVNAPRLLLLLMLNEDVPSASWQSSPHLFCLPRCPTSVLTAAFNVLQRRGSFERLFFYYLFPPTSFLTFFHFFFFTFAFQPDGLTGNRSDCDDCDLIKTWPRAKKLFLSGRRCPRHKVTFFLSYDVISYIYQCYFFPSRPVFTSNFHWLYLDLSFAL